MIYIPKIADEANDFWTSLIQGAQMAAEDYGVKLELYAPDSETNYEMQNEYLMEAIKKHPDAILISPSNYTGNNTFLEKVKEEGIHLVFIDSEVSEEIQELTVATDNVDMGRQLGEFACSFLKEDSQIVMVGHVQNSSTAIEREKGIRKGLGAFEENVLETVFCGSKFSVAYEQTCELLKKYPELTMVIGMNEYSAVGAARAVRDMKRGNQVVVLGIDSSLEMIELMEAGIFRGVVIQKPFNMGYLGVEETVKLLEGKRKSGTYINSGTKLITINDIYTEENQKLLFPFVGNQQ
ncbi:MAG: substrate-binding domain-containing protein [Eubacteriales bacterium]|nr:substrate-binding domain-containing protein [Eubacteriales bacterium]